MKHYETPNGKRFQYEATGIKSDACTESVWCAFCYGSGLRRHRDENKIDPRITIKTCTRCKGRKRLWVPKDTELYHLGKDVIAGLYPGIRKTKR
jgi:hypothetical protein